MWLQYLQVLQPVIDPPFNGLVDELALGAVIHVQTLSIDRLVVDRLV